MVDEIKTDLKKINRGTFFGLAVAVICFLADILSKIYIKTGNVTFDIIPGFMKISPVENTGLAFSMLGNIPYIALSLNLVMFIALIMVWKKMNLFFLSISVGGALGNLIERILFGHVTDFINVTGFSIFNIGDSLIFIGIALTLIFSRKQFGDEKNTDVQKNPEKKLIKQ